MPMLGAKVLGMPHLLAALGDLCLRLLHDRGGPFRSRLPDLVLVELVLGRDLLLEVGEHARLLGFDVGLQHLGAVLDDHAEVVRLVPRQLAAGGLRFAHACALSLSARSRVS